VRPRLTPEQSRLVVIAIALLLGASLAILSVRLARSQAAVHALEQARVAQAEAIDRNREVLDELCSTNAVINGLVAQTIALFEKDLSTHSLPPKVVPTYEDTLATFKGYRVVLNQQTACAKVKNP
jgi:type II secretory pathway pseudopilin PulG